VLIAELRILCVISGIKNFKIQNLLFTIIFKNNTISC